MNYIAQDLPKTGDTVLVGMSGGVDSTTCLGMAVDLYGKENVVALSVSYGQKHKKELEEVIYFVSRICLNPGTSTVLKYPPLPHYLL